MSTSGRKPLLALVGTTLAIGIWSVSGVTADPLNRMPDTPFSNGALFAASLARAELGRRGYLANHTDLFAWPGGAAFYPIMWPTLGLALLMEPVLAVSLTMALTPLANAVGGWALARGLKLSPTSQAAAGALLACSPWVRETLANGQLEQAWPGAVALLWALALRARDQPAIGTLIGLFVLAGACGASFPHLALGGGIGLGAWFAWDARRTTMFGTFASLAAVALGLGLAARWHAAGYASAISVFAPKGSGAMPTEVAGLPEYATVRALLFPPGPPTTPSGVLHAPWLGWVVPALAGYAAARRARGAGHVGLVVAAAALLLLSLGPEWCGLPMPYRLLTLASKTLEASGSAYRMVGAALVPLCMLAAAVPRITLGSAAVVLLAWGETLTFGTRPLPYMTVAVERDPDVPALNAHPGPILDLPLGNRLCPVGHYAVETARRGRPVTLITSGLPYSAQPGFLHREADVQNSPACGGRLRAFLVTEGFTSVVLHDHGCRIPDSLKACLNTALGPGENAPMPDATGTITWWSW